MPRPWSPVLFSLTAEPKGVTDADARPESLDIEVVYRRYALTVARWVLRFGGPELDYEDIVHEVFLKAQRELPKLSGDGKLSTWLYRVTLNEVRYRRRKARLRRFVAGFAKDFAGHLPSETPAAVELLEKREEAQRLHRALEALPEKFRVVLVLFELEGRKGEEVAELMGARVETVWVWLGRARAKLAAELERLEGAGE